MDDSAAAGAAAILGERLARGWSLDPSLVARLADAHDALTATLESLGAAVERRDATAVAAAARDCLAQMQALHRIEALQLYPAIARLFGADAESLGSFTRLRLEVNGLGRRFLRIVESALAEGTEGIMGTTDARLAAALLQRYADQKRRRVYPLYSAAVERAA